MKNESGFVPVGDLIKRLMKGYRQASGGDAIEKVWKHWDKVIADEIRQSARPLKLKRKTLLVHVYSSVWLHKLQFSKREIIKKINNAAGEELIRDIQFKIGTF
jgi:predicted nucleic acid-binding Zn ribbon protein